MKRNQIYGNTSDIVAEIDKDYSLCVNKDGIFYALKREDQTSLEGHDFHMLLQQYPKIKEYISNATRKTLSDRPIMTPTTELLLAPLGN